MHALRQDERDPDSSGRRVRKGRRKPRSDEEKDRFLLTVSTLARLDRVGAAEFEMFWEYAVPPDE